MRIDLDLSVLAECAEKAFETLDNIEAGRGADGVGHGRLKPPSESILEQNGEGAQ